MLLSFTVDTLILFLHCRQRKKNKEVVEEEDVAPDKAPSNRCDDDESIEEESDNVDENEENDADADEESNSNADPQVSDGYNNSKDDDNDNEVEGRRRANIYYVSVGFEYNKR